MKNQSGCPHSIACKVVELDLLNANFFHEKYGQPYLILQKKFLKKYAPLCKHLHNFYVIINLAERIAENMQRFQYSYATILLSKQICHIMKKFAYESRS